VTVTRNGRRRAAFLAAALLCLAAAAAPAPAQNMGGTVREKRIRFLRGRTTAVEKGSIAFARSRVYRLGARSGQTMSLHLASASREVTFSLIAPGGETVEGAFGVRDWSGELPESGDYTITVVNNRERSAASPYTLQVTIR